MQWQNIYDLGGLNRQIFLAVNHIHGPVWDSVMLMGTLFGNYYSMYGLYMALAFIIVSWRFNMLRGKKSTLPDNVDMARVMLHLGVVSISFVLAILISDFIKDFVHMPRPFIALPPEEVTRLDRALPSSADRQSFPSGHSVFTAVMIFGYWPLMHRPMRILAVLIGIWVVISRMALGVHFPVDLIGGFTLGALTVLTVRTALLHAGPPVLRMPMLKR